VQIRLQQVGVDVSRIEVVAITHLHGDHFLGLYPLIQTYVLRNVSQKLNKKLTIVAPKPLCKSLESIPQIVCIDASENLGFETVSNDISLIFVPINHGDIEAYGIVVRVVIDRRRGNSMKIFYSGDGVCDERCRERLVSLRPIDIVIHEASFSSRDLEKARASGHATVDDAVELALWLGAKLLVLIHVSSRYSTSELLQMLCDARQRFRNVVLAQDLSLIPLSLVYRVAKHL